jgi:hypothetical protein
VAERHAVETIYRGRRVAGEWFVEDGRVHVTSDLGNESVSLGGNGRSTILPSETAERLLWQMARKADPKRSIFFWR